MLLITYLRIGELAQATGFSPRTLRYYESIGLLRPTARSSSAYRLYAKGAVDKLLFVRRAQGLGLTLADIRSVLEKTEAGIVPCEHVVAVVDKTLSRVEGQIARLQELRRELLGLKSRLAETAACGDVQPGSLCPCVQETSVP